MAKYVDLDKIIANLEETVEKHKADTSKENAMTAWIFKRFIAELEKIPSTDVIPVRHGHWIPMGDCGVTRCSCCGWSIEECIEDKYCRGCGAKMDETS